MKQKTRLIIDGVEHDIPVRACCNVLCIKHLKYDGDNDGTPDNISVSENTITITPTDLSVGECDNDVVYALQNDVSGVSLNTSNAVITIDCRIASQEFCNLTLLIDTLCDGTVISTRSIAIVLTCGECAEDEGDTEYEEDTLNDDYIDMSVIDNKQFDIFENDNIIGATVKSFTTPQYGTLQHVSDGVFNYSLDTDSRGEEISFVVTVETVDGNILTQTVYIDTGV